MRKDMPYELIEVPKCKNTATSLVVPDGTTMDEWTHIGHVLGLADHAMPFLIGDWLRFGEENTYISSGRYDEAARITGLSAKTLQNYAYVTSKIESSRRREDVGFSIHAEVAPLPPDKQVEWLQLASTGLRTVSQIRQAIKKQEPSWTRRTENSLKPREDRGDRALFRFKREFGDLERYAGVIKAIHTMTLAGRRTHFPKTSHRGSPRG